MKTAVIVGVQGVGMAHAIACEKLGIRVVGVLDTDPEAQARLEFSWVNEWGPYKDVIANPKSRPIFTTELDKIRSVSADLLIVACPTKSHTLYLRELGPKYEKILVEKPLAYTVEDANSVPFEIQRKTYVSHEWLCHPDFPNVDPMEPFHILHGHKYPPTEPHKKDCGVIWDLGSHALAHLLAQSPPSRWQDLEVAWKDIRPSSAILGLQYGWEGQAGVVHVGYNEIGPGECVINGKILNWQDLFVDQLKMLASGTHPAPFELGAKVVEILSTVSPYGE